MRSKIVILSLFALVILPISVTHSYAINDVQTTISPIDSSIGLEKTTLTFTIPEDNTYPWAFIEGKIKNAVPDYPVIIQIYDDNLQSTNGNNNGAVHFAQTNVNADGSYQYRFRVSDMQDGNVVNFFEGKYIVKIFKVVFLNPDLNVI